MFRGLSGEDDGDLADESTLSSKLGGMLIFEKPEDIGQTSDHGTAASSENVEELDEENGVVAEGGLHRKKLTGTKIVFEVVSAKIVNSIRKKYVVYSLLVKKTPGLDRSPAVIERRYSDFLELFLNLKKRFSEDMHSVTYFPKKTVMGNFNPDVITSRSKAFEQFLYYIYSIDHIRYSSELAEFLFNRELREAHNFMHHAKFEDAIPILENAYFLQGKILGESHSTTVNTLCELIAMHNAIDNITEAHKFAEIALLQFAAGHHEKNELFPSLLQLSIRLCWSLGKEKRELESQLQALSQHGIRIDNLPTLLDLVMNKCK